MRRAALAGVALLVVLSGCSGDSGDSDADSDADPTGSPSPSTSTSAAPAKAAPFPKKDACYRLTFEQAVAPTAEDDSVGCRTSHTAQTFHVGRLDTVVDGHLLAVDSAYVRNQPVRECPRRLATYLGTTPSELRLSMLQAVWFTPTVAASDAGEDWYRCDVIALATGGRLAPLRGQLARALASPAGRARYGVCARTEPGTRNFRRVICTPATAWRAISTVNLRGRDYPGQKAVQAAGQSPCEDVARRQADDPLSFTWGYEWPTKQQWDAGQRYGVCWMQR
ncbi:septum formation family protein [Nocardioides speluncae]|uniref:septum formation family protein n=1 Tax=Nocardioides speluncae TaxID=2670337 RepID=UPI000D686DFE|nr:septum formation family protein [Nocardioides speluncae]